MGSLLAAAASYLRARQLNGRWLLRIENIDPPREAPGATNSIIDTLSAFGFQWDGPIVFQSDRFDLYRNIVRQLIQRNRCYRCRCSRQDIQQYISLHELPAGIYPGICRDIRLPHDCPAAWRLDCGIQQIEFEDRLLGPQHIKFQHDQGDFVIWRKDDLPSYQLAVTVDDHEQCVTEIVRGADLLAESAGQHLLRTFLHFRQPELLHIPLIVDSDGQKLSKQTGATALDPTHAAQQLLQAFEYLGLPVSAAPISHQCSDLWSWAIEHWDYNSLKNIDFWQI